MRVPNYYRLAIIAVAAILSETAVAQLSEADKTAAIQTIAGHIAANYVFPEKGGQIASHIQLANFQGDFKKAGNWEQFDSMVTVSLRKFSNDRHLYVRNNKRVVDQLKDPSIENNDEEQMKDNEQSDGNNYGFSESKILPGNVGYLKISAININKKSLPVLYKAMRAVENSDALIIDLRDNGGGGSELGAVLESYFLPAALPVLEFNTRKGINVVDSTVTWLEEKKYERPVYIIINRNTASAAEAFAFVLQQNKRAKIVGESSSGAAYMNEWFAVDDENYVSVSTAAPSLPGRQKSWEITGVKPDIRMKKGDPVAYITENILNKKG